MTDTEIDAGTGTGEKAKAKSPERKAILALARASFLARQTKGKGPVVKWSEVRKEELKAARKTIKRLEAKGFGLVKKDA